MSDGSDGVGWDEDDEAGDDVDGVGDDVDGAGATDDNSGGVDGNGPEYRDADGKQLDEEGEEEEFEPSVAGVFGARPEDAPPRPEIVPEMPEFENVVFVLLGVLLGLFVIYRAVVVFGG